MKKLGIHPFGHDSAICIIDHEKKDIFAISLERITRFKHDYRFAHPLLEQFCDIDEETKFVISMLDVNVDRIEFGEKNYQLDNLTKKHKSVLKSDKSKISKAFEIFKFNPFDLFKFYSLKIHLNSLSFERDLNGFASFLSKKYGVKVDNIKYTDHHFAHACSTYYSAPSEFKNNSLIMTLDGQGDGSFCKIFKVENNKPIEIASSPNDSSIPLLYAIFTGVAGFTPNADEGKLEALACYGDLTKENELYKLLEKSFSFNDNFEIVINKNNPDFPFYSISKQYGEIGKFLKLWKEKIGDKDFSAAMQLFFEEFFLGYIQQIQQKFKAKNIAFAGGGFANVKLNLRVIEANIFENVFIFHAMGDDGCPLGALIYDDVCDGINVDWIRNNSMPYYGTSYTKDEVEIVLRKSIDKITYQYLGKTSYIELAKDITENKICALFQGKMEYGPRALCH